MICSVLIPSRARPDRLLKTINSIFKTASKDNIEILLRFDDDDEQTLLRKEEFKNCKIIIGPRKNGYNSLGDFYTDLADIAKSDWIWIMNDDAVVVGDNWDLQLSSIPIRGFIVQPELYQLGHSKYFNVEGGAFPIVPNKCWNLFGKNAFPNFDDKDNPTDFWIDQLLRSNGWKTQFLVGVSVIHDRDSDEAIKAHRSIL